MENMEFDLSMIGCVIDMWDIKIITMFFFKKSLDFFNLV